MSSAPDVSFFLQSLIWSLPSLLLHLVGLVLAFVFWRRSPPACGAAAGGFAVFLFGGLVQIGNSWFIQMQINDPSGMSDPGSLNMILSAVMTALRFLGWILILIAIYGWRNDPVPFFPPSTNALPPLSSSQTDTPPPPSGETPPA